MARNRRASHGSSPRSLGPVFPSLQAPLPVLHRNDKNPLGLGSIVHDVGEPSEWGRAHISIEDAIQRWVVLYPVHSVLQRLQEAVSQARHKLFVVGVRCIDIVLGLGEISDRQAHRGRLTRARTSSQLRTLFGFWWYAAKRRSSSALRSSVNSGCQPPSTRR